MTCLLRNHDKIRVLDGYVHICVNDLLLLHSLTSLANEVTSFGHAHETIKAVAKEIGESKHPYDDLP